MESTTEPNLKSDRPYRTVGPLAILGSGLIIGIGIALLILHTVSAPIQIHAEKLQLAPTPEGKISPILSNATTKSDFEKTLSDAIAEGRGETLLRVESCLNDDTAACTRLGIMAASANPRTYADFRRLAFALACERGNEIAPCTRLYKDANSDEKKSIRIALDQNCHNGAERLCTALAEVIEMANPALSKQLLETTCASHSHGFACRNLVQNSYRTLPPEQAERGATKLCEQGASGACYQMAIESFSIGKAALAQQWLEVICTQTNEQSRWRSAACAMVARIDFQNGNIEKAAAAFQQGCSQANESDMSLCHSIANDLKRTTPADAASIDATIAIACNRLKMTREECAGSSARAD